MSPRSSFLGMVVAVALVAAGCGTPTIGSKTASGSAGTTPFTPRLAGALTVFAAASLTESFNDYKARLVSENRGLSITYSFAGSPQLVTQIGAGAPADVVATADEDSMAKLVSTGLVEPPQDLARNKLEIAVAPGNPKGIKALRDLARSGLKVVLADPSVPAGRYGRQALAEASVTVEAVSLELDVKSVLQKVTSGEADAGLVYVTDVMAAGPSVAGIDIPVEYNAAAAYPVAVVRTTKYREGARAFVDGLLRGPGQAALSAHGFLVP